MILIGTRYSTYRDDNFVVKCEDLRTPHRLPVRCYRECLAARLGSRLGLPIPATELVIDPTYGRVARQRWIDNAARPTAAQVDAVRFEAVGVRILLLDLLVANTDRRLDNLLVRNGMLVPIDFNVAFAFASSSNRTEPPSQTIMRWFGPHGALMLPRNGLETFETEIARFEHLLSEAYIRFAIAQLPSSFIDDDERIHLEHGVLTRRAALGTWIRDWWRTTVVPAHQLTKVNHE